MFFNYLKVAFRNLYRHFGYTLINVAGLAIGLACSILILLYVVNELTYDRFNTKADRIYRIAVRGQMPGNELNQAVTAAPMMVALREDYPEVEAVSGNSGGGCAVRARKNSRKRRRISSSPIRPFSTYSISGFFGEIRIPC